jgi:hypothetical protein
VTPTEANTLDLTRTREVWLAAIHREDREAESACMARLDRLLDQWLEFTPERGTAWGNCSTQ